MIIVISYLKNGIIFIEINFFVFTVTSIPNNVALLIDFRA